MISHTRTDQAALEQIAGLSHYLAKLETEVEGSVWRIREPISVRYEITALQVGLERLHRRPVIVVEHPLMLDGSTSAIPVVTNLQASRVLAARIFGIENHQWAAGQLASKMRQGIPPVSISRAEAPVTARMKRGARVSLSTELPALVQHALDPGPYLSAAHVCTFDPDTLIDNTAIQRAFVKGPRELRFYPFSGSHNALNIRKWWNKGQAAPVALWIGHIPSVDLGSNQKLRYPESHWDRAGALLGGPVRLMPTELFGNDLMVPADAEIVIEGYVRKDELRAEGPFGEYTGYLGPQRPSPVIDVEVLTMREHPLYHDYGSGLPDMLVPDNIMLESALFEALDNAVPSLKTVHVPTSGRRFHCYIQLERPKGGEAQEAIHIVLQNRRIKHVVVVDEDIDVFDESAVLWAIATRVQWSRDVMGFTDRECSPGDPSLPVDQKVSDKAGIDATLPESLSASRPRPTAGIIQVGDDIDSIELVRRLGGPGINSWISE